ncbi:MAG: hypothetical protein QXL73_03885, partial [Thermoplasmata archaeon]
MKPSRSLYFIFLSEFATARLAAIPSLLSSIQPTMASIPYAWAVTNVLKAFLIPPLFVSLTFTISADSESIAFITSNGLLILSSRAIGIPTFRLSVRRLAKLCLFIVCSKN